MQSLGIYSELSHTGLEIRTFRNRCGSITVWLDDDSPFCSVTLAVTRHALVTAFHFGICRADLRGLRTHGNSLEGVGID